MMNKDNLETKAKALLKEFEDKCLEQGISLKPAIIFTDKVLDSITQRERTLVNHIVGTYLAPTYDVSEISTEAVTGAEGAKDKTPNGQSPNKKK